MPYLTTAIPEAKRAMAANFHSEHSKRSLIKLEPLEQRRFRSVEARPVTTSSYLTESVQRHKEMEESKLREYLKAKESEVNQMWNKPAWPGPKKDDESLRELEHIKKSIETLQKAANAPPKDDRPRSIMKRKELESKEQMMWPVQQMQVVQHKPTVTETVQRFEETRRTEEVERRVQRREKRERRSRHHSSSRHHSGYNDGYHHHEHHEFHRTASMPRIVYKSSNRAMNSDEIDKIVREAYEAADEARRDADKRGYRSSSLSRSGHAGYLPASNETYYKREATRREHHSNRGGGERYEDEFGGRGLAHARYGSLSDSLRRGELKYIPNGDVREPYYRNGDGRSMHKSYSTRDVFSGGHEAAHDHRSASSMRRGSQQASPFVEYPPSLPRRAGREDYYSYKPVSKSRSYADWDDAGRAGFGKEIKRYDDDMTRLEAEFRDSLLMPMPNGNVNDREHRTEQIPGGYETFHKDNRANSGRRAGRDGRPVDFNEATQEYSYKREQEFDDRRRR
ncbi:hypothetical protein WR25_05090 isoform B [Diploscapter pachys]|uniref:Uncharacterized protein n=1 Tax=Diploscapter pachys TaxID=2018661 RepID=A0A2A2J833_9BILA|nr:hypothetical protein WR25_05090 isoform A [Diploscapter pachys]PAV57771.1 hypothetical protein WR25_05090 isoform B [Diploscapter pachys]